VDIPSPALEKLPIFAAIGVPEVWSYDSTQVGIMALTAGIYRSVDASSALPGVTGEILGQFIAASKTLRRADWQHSIQAWAQQQRLRLATPQ